MKKLKNKTKDKRKSSKKRKLKKGRRLAVSMVNTVAGIDKRIIRMERLTKKILDSMGEVGNFITLSENRFNSLELSRWGRFKNWLFGRSG